MDFFRLNKNKWFFVVCPMMIVNGIPWYLFYVHYHYNIDIMHIIYGVVYFKSYIHKQHLFWGPVLFSHYQILTVPGGNNVKKFVCKYIRIFQVEYRCNYFGLIWYEFSRRNYFKRGYFLFVHRRWSVRTPYGAPPVPVEAFLCFPEFLSTQIFRMYERNATRGHLRYVNVTLP
jgi:hypothetical protein